MYVQFAKWCLSPWYANDREIRREFIWILPYYRPFNCMLWSFEALTASMVAQTVVKQMCSAFYHQALADFSSTSAFCGLPSKQLLLRSTIWTVMASTHCPTFGWSAISQIVSVFHTVRPDFFEIVRQKIVVMSGINLIADKVSHTVRLFHQHALQIRHIANESTWKARPPCVICA